MMAEKRGPIDSRLIGRQIDWQDNVRGRVMPQPQSVSSIPQTHGREEKHREKEKTHKQERFTLVMKANKQRLMSSERDVRWTVLNKSFQWTEHKDVHLTIGDF